MCRFFIIKKDGDVKEISEDGYADSDFINENGKSSIMITKDEIEINDVEDGLSATFNKKFLKMLLEVDI